MVRLVLLYCLCYEGQSGYNPAYIVELLKSRGVSDSKCKVSTHHNNEYNKIIIKTLAFVKVIVIRK